MEWKIKTIESKRFIGMSQDMSLIENKTMNLFSSFMPRRKEILNKINNEVLDLKIYPLGYFEKFNPNTKFTKWALQEVSSTDHIPSLMSSFLLPGGQYVVFYHMGDINDSSPFEYIFREWLPNSAYAIDQRPHFDVMSEKTKLNDPKSEQHIWIPIKSR